MRQKFQLWVDADDLVRWKSVFGVRGVSAEVRRRMNQGCLDLAGNSSVGVSVVCVAGRGRFVSSCTNAGYHWRGACRFCGGG